MATRTLETQPDLRRGPMFRRGRDNEAHPSALLAILCVATFMTSLDVFIVNVGLRLIGKDLGSGSLADLSWIITAYAIVLAALLVPAGRLADRYGVKQAFLFGLAVFTLGSLGCALSSDLWVIVGLRCPSLSCKDPAGVGVLSGSSSPSESA